jgi:hypothetical protein
MATYHGDGGSYYTTQAPLKQVNEELLQKEGVKHDSGKLPEHLASPVSHKRLLEVLRFGAGKYNERNWEAGMDWSRLYAAAERHLHSWWAGESNDSETGLSHLAHALACLHFLNHYEHLKVGKDDRPKYD